MILGGTEIPLQKGGVAYMIAYVTYDALIQCGIFIIALIGLVFQICDKRKK